MGGPRYVRLGDGWAPLCTFRGKEKYLATAGNIFEPRLAQLVAQSLYQIRHLDPG